MSGLLSYDISEGQQNDDFLSSSLVIGLGLGAYAHKIYGPLTEKIVKILGVPTGLPDPFGGLDLLTKLVLTPFVCFLGPISEEQTFRGDLQGTLREKFESYFVNRGFSESTANIAARVTAIFFASVIFGLVHFMNAIVFWCNPILFLPQVVAATIMGLIFGLAKECAGNLDMPIGMHIGNNTLAWANYLRMSL